MATNLELSANQVIEICQAYMSESNLALVKDALNYAERSHQGQMRLSGEPYINHPIQVAGILAELHLDPATVATGFLHDVVEDTPVTMEEIQEQFGETVAFLVDGVTKLGKINFKSKQEALAENHRKMLLAMAKDMRVIIVKLADRLHNMRTMKYQKPEKQIEKSQEAIEVYAPLADRLGMSNIKWELEDIALRYINPTAYYRIVKQMDTKRVEREEYIQATIEEIYESLKDIDINAEVYGRPKHIYSIYRKMVDQHKEFDDIYDLLAIRVIVGTIKDCYAVLGAVHTKWKPMPGRFKDYIAMPKANMYQSIHTTVIGPKGKPVEIQIRTHQMHEIAEYGVAAHWAYKEGKLEKVSSDDNIQKQLKWFKDIVDLQDEAKDAREFMDFVKEDIFKDQVYIFTPQGDVFELPSGSGPIDFAYHVHTEIGNKTVGAKVNGNIVSLNYKLKNGDIVEILTNSNSNGPSRDWLKITSTSKARNKIRRFFKVKDREENGELGMNLLDKELRANDHSLKDIQKRKIEEDLMQRYNFATMADFYGAIGLGELNPTTIVNYLGWRSESTEQESQTPDKEKKNQQAVQQKLVQRQKSVHESGVVVEGVDNLMIRLSRCCNPVPGDEIVGYITKGRGISVHRKDCPNLLSEPELQKRTIPVEWDLGDAALEDYETDLKIIGFDRSGLINDVLHVINHSVKSLISVNARNNPDSQAVIQVKVLVANKDQLNDLMTKLGNIPDIYEVFRMSS
ncbi:RelA/SpoT family protein [Ignavigranum ruoffiae]|uniref:RelA/SpoT family protein n=1 Tax=Ignavigranum ruoffiae TaxID=89093 RepID=UPI0024AD0DC7|nr:bifunctional (p)ppGpp synthetase/guanosine-3',5'-bis(diphosphate) 3'-pyrophosphohydrolase [Ignavigranum ruoffiae]